MTPTEIILNIYRKLIAKRTSQGIPVNLRAKAIVGTVQDDPFDCWVENEISSSLPKNFDVYHSGALTTPEPVAIAKPSSTMGLQKPCAYRNGRTY